LNTDEFHNLYRQFRGDPPAWGLSEGLTTPHRKS